MVVCSLMHLHGYAHTSFSHTPHPPHIQIRLLHVIVIVTVVTGFSAYNHTNTHARERMFSLNHKHVHTQCFYNACEEKRHTYHTHTQHTYIQHSTHTVQYYVPHV